MSVAGIPTPRMTPSETLRQPRVAGPSQPSMSVPRRMLLFGLVVVALALLCCWGFRVQSGHAMCRTSVVTSCKRPGSALNLPSSTGATPAADVRRFLTVPQASFTTTSPSGPSLRRSTEAHAKAARTGTVTGAPTQTADTAQALVAVSVQTSNAGGADPGSTSVANAHHRAAGRRLVKVIRRRPSRELVAGDRLRAAARAGVGADVWRGLREPQGRRRPRRRGCLVRNPCASRPTAPPRCCLTGLTLRSMTREREAGSRARSDAYTADPRR